MARLLSMWYGHCLYIYVSWHEWHMRWAPRQIFEVEYALCDHLPSHNIRSVRSGVIDGLSAEGLARTSTEKAMLHWILLQTESTCEEGWDQTFGQRLYRIMLLRVELVLVALLKTDMLIRKIALYTPPTPAPHSWNERAYIRLARNQKFHGFSIIKDTISSSYEHCYLTNYWSKVLLIFFALY